MQDTLINRLADKHDLDKRIVKEICHSPFRFAIKVMQSDDDFKTIRMRYLCKFVIKNKHRNTKDPIYWYEYKPYVQQSDAQLVNS